MITKERRDVFIEDLLDVFNKHNMILRDSDLYGLKLTERPVPAATIHVERYSNDFIMFYWYRGIADNVTFKGVVGLLDGDNNEINYEGYARQEATFKSCDSKLINTTQIVFPQCPPHTKAVVRKLLVFVGEHPLFSATLNTPVHLYGELPIMTIIDIGELVIE